MAITDTAPTAAESSSAPSDSQGAPAPGGLAALVGTSDHKVIGRLYIGTAFLFVLVSGIVGELASVDRVDHTIGNTILTAKTYGQATSLHAISGPFLFLLPLLLGIALVVVPLQVGSRSIAFPRAAAASYWAFLLSGSLLIASYAIDRSAGSTTKALELWNLSLIGVLASLLLATVCVVTTVIALRTTGMTLDRTPLFSWSMLVAGTIWLLTIPVAIGIIVLMYVDFRNGQAFWGKPSGFLSHIEWLWGQPQVYAYAVPVLGLAADVIASLTGVRHTRPRTAMVALGLAAVLGFGAYTATFKNADVTSQALYVGMAFLALLPVLMLAGLWADTLRRGTVKVSSPLVFAVGSYLLVLAGVVAGAVGAVSKFDLNGTLYNQGQAHLVLLGATVGAIGGLHYWATKVARRPLSEGLGLGAAAILVIGAFLVAVPDLLSGGFGKGTDVHAGVKALNGVIAAGGALVLIGVLMALVNLLGAAKQTDEAADADPWNGNTLEWLTASPPSLENFDGPVPLVSSEAPLLDAREAKEASA